MITTAIFGGSFDPVHNEHVNIAKACVRELGIKTLVILPTSNPPHKKASDVDFYDRAEMARIAFANIAENVIIDTLEEDNGGINYIANNLPILQKKYGDFYYIVGGDSIRDIEKWYRPDIIIGGYNICAFNRGGCIDITEIVNCLNKKYNGHIKVMDYVGCDVDSHTIRNILLLHLDTNDIASDVLSYINDKNLYNKFDNVIERVKPFYFEKRFFHAKNTTLTALYYNNVCKLGLSYDKVFITALLHDIGKKCDKDGVPNWVDIPFDAKGTPVQHQFVGAEIANKYFDIDEDMYNAIKYHTTGRENMSALEKLIYTADILSFERDYDGVEELREITTKDFDKGFVTCLKRGYDFVLESGKTLYPLTEKALLYYKERL